MEQEAPGRRENLIAIALMTLGMAFTASVDAVIKGASTAASPAQIVTAVGFGMATIFLTVLVTRRERILDRALLHPAVVARTILEVVGSFGTVLALSLVTLTVVTTIGQTVPILVTLGAILLFKARPKPTDWLALMGGLAGMLLIVRPGLAGFDPASLIAVVAAIGLAGRDLSSRAAPRSATTAHLGVLGGLALGICGLILAFLSPDPMPPVTAQLATSFIAIVAFATLAFLCITTAMRMGEIPVVSPFRYARLFFGVTLGVVIFGDSIDLRTAVGAGLIAFCGIYLLLREAR